MITARASQLVESCKQYVNCDKERRNREEYERLREGLKEIADALFPTYLASAAMRGLQPLGVGDLNPNPQAGQLKTQCMEALAKFAASPASQVGQNQFPLPRFKREATAVARRAEEDLLALWTRYVDVSVPVVPVELVALFARIPGKRDAADDVTQLASEVRSTRVQLPRDRQQLDALGDLVLRLSVALRKLFRGHSGEPIDSNEPDLPEARDMPDNVREFIDKASTISGAPVTTASTEVLSWLREAGIIDAFVVRTATPRP